MLFIEIIEDILKDLSPQYIVTLKLHPRISGKEIYNNAFQGNDRVIVTQEGIIYDYLSVSKYIIGDTSTVLYEAAALEKKVFVIDTEMSREWMSKDFGIWIKDGKEFVEKMNREQENKNKYTSKDYFADNWEENYSNFLNEIVYSK